MIRLLSIACLALVLTACASTEDMQNMAQEAAKVADKALEAAEWYMCKGSTVGAIQRRYGRTKAKADAWAALCVPDGGFVVPFGPEPVVVQ